MATTIKKQAEKQAAKITRKTIQQASEAAKETVATGKQELLNRIEEAQRACETEGRDAFTNLRRLRGEKLQRGEEVVIARHLHTELSVLKRHLRARNIGLGEFCSQFGLTDASESSKELHRLTLSPDKSTKEVRLRRTADKYRRLIEAISKITHESVSTLADRVLRGTSLHPSQQTDGMTVTEKVQAALQGIVDKIDSEFGLHATFVEIAELKAAHIQKGGTTCWPHCDISRDWLSSEEYEQEMKDASDIRYAFWKRPNPPPVWELDDRSQSEVPQVRSEVRSESPPDQDWQGWPMSYDSGALQNTGFFYVPHAPLGVINFADIPRKQNSPARHEETVMRTLEWWRSVDTETGLSLVTQECSINDEWDTETQSPVGQLDNHSSSRGSDFAWLIIYPTRDGSRLMPMLYVSYQEGGPFILPLDARNLEVFRDAIWFDETKHMSVFDRIKELLGYRPGTPRVIEDGFRRTVPWLDHNPFFKMRQQYMSDLKMLDAFCNELWEEK